MPHARISPYSGSHKQKFRRIPDPANKSFSYSGSHTQEFPRIPDPTNKSFLYSGSHTQKFPVFWIPQEKTFRISDPTNKNVLYSRSQKQNFPDNGIWSTLHVAKKGVYISRSFDSFLSCYLYIVACDNQEWDCCWLLL